jgi:type I restriction enzyme S subunit|tara:strand:- start:589 stop:1839 length:1251 start_codon:yes stop_codon:yes gene_type:complete
MIKELTIEKTSLPVGWEMKKIDEVVIDYHQGLNTAGQKIKFVEEGYPIIQTRNLNQGEIDISSKIKFMSKVDWELYKDKYKPSVGDVFLTNIGTIGKTAVVTIEEDYLIHWNIFIFKLDKSKVLPLYLKLFLDSPSSFDYYHSFQKGGTVSFITKKMISNLEIPLPPLPQQKQIVAILDKAFAAIDTAKTNAEQNLQNAKELFESYLQNVFENKGDDWEEKTLGDVLQKTETVNPKSTPNNEFVYLDVSSVNKETKLIEKTTTLLGKDAPSRARKLVKTNDIIFATVRPTHSRVAIITDEYNNQVCSTGYYVLRPKSIIENHYLFYFILTFSFNKLMESMQKGASYPAVNNKEVESVVINFPKSIKEQQKIVERLDSLSTETKKLEAIYTQKIADLEEMKKSVLQKAFSGQLNTIN